jgi:hypothetical protein
MKMWFTLFIMCKIEAERTSHSLRDLCRNDSENFKILYFQMLK